MSLKWKSFAAKFKGWCHYCHENIEVGEDCVYSEEEKVVHLRCAEENE